jgi:hypothetical protein
MQEQLPGAHSYLEASERVLVHAVDLVAGEGPGHGCLGGNDRFHDNVRDLTPQQLVITVVGT